SLRLGRIDDAYARMRVRRAQEISMRVVLWIDVIGILAGAGEKTIVFLAADRLAHAVQIAGAHRYLPIACAPCFTALTMFWQPVQRHRLPSSSARIVFS